MFHHLTELPEELIKETCERMSLDDLYGYIQTSHHSYNLCHDIYNAKYQEWYSTIGWKLEVKNFILDKLEKISPDYIYNQNIQYMHQSIVDKLSASAFDLILDVTSLDFQTVAGIITKQRSFQNELNRRSIPDYPRLIVHPAR